MMTRPIDSLVRKGLSPAEADPATEVGFGVREMDEALRLPRARLHEFFAAGPADAGAASAFALLMALRGRRTRKPVIWVSEERSKRDLGQFYAPGLVELGGEPNDLWHVETPDRLTALRVMVDILRCGAVGAVIAAFSGEAPMPDLTASRRLTLAAEQNDVMAILLRVGARPSASAAYSRWQVSSAPSTPLEGDAPGLPSFDLKLLRHRGGIAGLDIRLEWNRDRLCFQEPAPSGALVPLPRLRPAGDRPEHPQRLTA